MFYFSKSKYCLLCQCPKLLWLKENRPELIEEDTALDARMETGNRVGDLAMGLFGNYVEVTARKGDEDLLDLDEMKRRTEELMAAGCEVICEASFSYEGLYCAVDILKKEGDGYAIFEVKSSTHPNKEIYAHDVAYQKYVLTRCGVKVTGTYIITIDSSYVMDDELDINKLFLITDISEGVDRVYPEVEPRLELGKIIMRSDEPTAELSLNCTSPYDCPFFDYCTSALPSPSVFDTYNLGFEKKLELYKCGVVSLADVRPYVKNALQILQIESIGRGDEIHTDRENLHKFLDTLPYPLYFLDFESMQLPIPEFKGTKPFAQIPFQYSLHILESGGELIHKEFLAESGTDPRRKIAERLIEDIPRGVTVVAYNKSFEATRLRELAKLFPDLSDELYAMAESIVDLMVPFRRGYCYTPAMGGSVSIKKVLPALFPDSPELDYHNLKGIQNGNDAMSVFPEIRYMSDEDATAAREALLRYCELDTLAMVRIFEKLTELSS